MKSLIQCFCLNLTALSAQSCLLLTSRQLLWGKIAFTFFPTGAHVSESDFLFYLNSWDYFKNVFRFLPGFYSNLIILIYVICDEGNMSFSFTYSRATLLWCFSNCSCVFLSTVACYWLFRNSYCTVTNVYFSHAWQTFKQQKVTSNTTTFLITLSSFVWILKQLNHSNLRHFELRKYFFDFTYEWVTLSQSVSVKWLTGEIEKLIISRISRLHL